MSLMWFVPLHDEGGVLSSTGPDTIHPAPSLCISSPSCLSPGGWCLCACWRGYKELQRSRFYFIHFIHLSILDGYSPGCSLEGKLCMATTLHGHATWVCPVLTGPAVLRLLQCLAPLISGWRNKGVAPAAWITSARFPAAPLCATHGAENTTFIQKHTSLNSNLFLFVFA